MRSSRAACPQMAGRAGEFVEFVANLVATLGVRNLVDLFLPTRSPAPEPGA